MQVNLTFASAGALFGTMVILAAVPSVSVFAVSARSASSGFLHGAFTTLGIVTGDIIFIVVALLGLSLLADELGDLFVIVRYVGGVYLIWLGLVLWKSRTDPAPEQATRDASLRSSFLTGLLITLGDQKAILFYFGLFPALFDLSALSSFDLGIILVIAITAVGGVKLSYAFMADRGAVIASAKTRNRITTAAAVVMIGVGAVLLATG